MSFSFKRMWTIFMSRNKEFYRDYAALGWVFVFPFLVIIAFSYMFNVEEQGIYKVGYIGQNPPKIELIQWVKYESNQEAQKKLQHHLIDMIIDLESKKYWISESSPKSITAQKIWIAHNSNITLEKEIVQGREIKYIDWLFPGLITMNVLWMALWGIGWVVVRQRRVGILKRFKASPLTPAEYLIAQLLSRLLVLIVTAVIIFAGSHLIYPFHTEGSYLTLFIVYIIGCLSISSLGFIIAARFTSEEFSNGMMNLITYPMMFLSEIWFSLEGSPEWVLKLAKFMPLWHLTDSMRRIMNEGATMMDVMPSITVMSAITIVFTIIGARLFKWT